MELVFFRKKIPHKKVTIASLYERVYLIMKI